MEQGDAQHVTTQVASPDRVSWDSERGNHHLAQTATFLSHRLAAILAGLKKSKSGPDQRADRTRATIIWYAADRTKRAAVLI